MAITDYMDDDEQESMRMPDDDIPMIPAGTPMPNVPRNPDSPREMLRRELERKYGNELRMMQPDMRRADREPRNVLMENNRDLAFQKLLANSAAGMGTIGGKAASTAGYDQFTNDLSKQNDAAYQGMMQQRKDISDAEDRRLKLMEYLDTKYGQDEALRTKREIAQAAAVRSAARDKKRDDQFDKTQSDKALDRQIKLMKDYGDEESTKKAMLYRDTLANAEALASQNTPEADTSLLYQYVRGNDPTTGVKDMELAIASRSGPIWDKIKAWAETMQSGQLLPEKKRNLLETIRGQAAAAEERLYDIDRTYDELARASGVDPELVIGKRRSRYKPQEKKKTTAPAAASTAAGPASAASNTVSQVKPIEQMSVEEKLKELEELTKQGF